MRTPSPPECRLDLVPPLADRFIVEVTPIDYSPVLLLMPFGFHLTMDTLPSGNCGAAAPGPPWSVSGFRLRARLGLSIPSALPGQRGVFPRFWIQRSSSERWRDFNPPEQCAAQRTFLSCGALSSPTARRFIPTIALAYARGSVSTFRAARVSKRCHGYFVTSPYQPTIGLFEWFLAATFPASQDLSRSLLYVRRGPQTHLCQICGMERTTSSRNRGESVFPSTPLNPACCFPSTSDGIPASVSPHQLCAPLVLTLPAAAG